MAEYHIHDQGPGPLLERIIGWDFRYTVCEGAADNPSIEAHMWHCRSIGVAATRRGVARVIRKQERERHAGRTLPFYEYPTEEVRP
jgi:hypothetical protein